MAKTKQSAASQVSPANPSKPTQGDPYSNLSENQVRGVLGQAFQGIPLSESAIQQYIKNPSALGGLTLGGQPMQGPGNQIPGASQAGYNPGWSGGQNVGNSLQMLNALGLLGNQQAQWSSAPPAPAAPTGPTVMNPVQLPQAQGQPVQAVGDQGAVPQPIRQYQSGGLVGGDQVQQIQPGVTRNAQGQMVYTDPALQTQLGLGNLSTAQQTALGLDPYNAQALSGATQVGYQYQPNFLGAAALNTGAVINLPPSGTPSSRSGVALTPGAIVGTGVPQIPLGPWLTNPSVFAKATPYKPTAPLAITPQAPATSVPYTAGQAFATPPAAPAPLESSLPPAMAQSGATTATPPAAMLPPGFMGGAQGAGYVPQAFMQAHTSALADAGMALYSHFGGDPNSASPADIANFHTQLTGAVGQHIGGAKPSAAGVKQAATGGLVPGRGNEDSVPALLTPGEYVIPKHQVAQLAARGVLKLASGGLVQDPDPDPPEARRQALTVQSGNAPGTSQPSGQPSSSSAQTSSPQVGGGNRLFSGLAQAAHTYGNAFSSIGTNAYQAPAGSSAMTVGQLGSGPMPGAGQTMSLGKLPAGGSGLQSALGGIGSGLSQAAQAIASSAQPWQMQQSAIPDPSQLPKYQIPTLQPERVA